MNFESLANELILYLFEFVRTDYLFHAFHGLNSRFDSLLVHHFIIFGIDFRSFYSNDFVTICQEYLPTLIDKIPSLNLCDKMRSSRSLHRLDTHGFTLDQFVQLKSLSLSYLSYKQLTGKIILALPHLMNLTHLILKCCVLIEDERRNLSTVLPLTNCIWSLPNLTHCYFDRSSANQFDYRVYIETTMTSSSITHLFMLNVDNLSFDLDHLCERTPNLQHFSSSFFFRCPHQFLTSPALSITSFELSLSVCECDLLNMFRWMPNLSRLKVKYDNYIGRHIWERIISNHLPKLKRFHFHISGRFRRGEIFEKQVDKLLNTFQTPFWRDKHNWFVRCNWDPIDGSFSLYTLPYAFGKFRVYKQEFGKSTWSQEKTQQSYDAVRHLEYHVKPTKYSQLSDMQFYKLDNLEITFPVNDHFWSMVPALNQLTSCKIRSCDNSEQSKIQLEHLLSHASHLSFLDFSCIGIHISIEILSLKVKNTSIKRLDLRKYSTSYNEEECVQLSHSPLVMQCEELHISVEKRISICHLVKTMLNLRLLYVKCDEDKEPWQYLLEDDNEEENLEEDELISWLRQQLTDVRPLMEISRWRYNIVLRLL